MANILIFSENMVIITIKSLKTSKAKKRTINLEKLLNRLCKNNLGIKLT